jgi:putative ABC transport system permease protein
VIMTTIFGFMPTLAAGQVRPNLVLRPSDTIIPQAGRARSFVALLVVMLAISLVAQTLIGDLLDSDTLRSIANSVGSVVGFLMAVAMIAGSIFSGWTRGKTGLRILRWVLLLGVLPILGGMFGQAVPAILILGGTFIQVGILYVVLWTVIWSVGGGELRSIWLLKLPRKRSTITKVLLAVVFLPVWILNAALLILMLPFWLLGRLIQRLAVVDFKIALRSMLASKGRGASTLLALVVGVFTLSLITMLADAITKRFEQILVNEVGGNVIIFAAGYENTLEQVATELDTIDGVKSYAAIEIYGVELVSALDVSEDETLTLAELEARAAAKNEYYDDYVRWAMSGIDGRAVDANLPDVDFYAGSQLSEADTGPWDPETGDYPPLIVSADEALVATKLSVGDLLTFKFTSEEDQTITFRIAGMIDRTGAQIQVNFGSSNYAPRNAFPEGVSPDSMSAIVDVKESNIRDVRQAMNAIPGTFVLETKLLNDLMNRIIDQFTSFPILVAGLALVVGGIVIANSVALSTLERRREIAIMKAVGLQRERVLGMLLLEYGLMGLIGGLIGVGLGGIGLLLLLIQAFGGELGKSIPYMTAFSLMGLCIVIALAAAILTAWNASGEKPLNVLRYE